MKNNQPKKHKCGTDGKTIWCYCGKCKQENYPLPKDFPTQPKNIWEKREERFDEEFYTCKGDKHFSGDKHNGYIQVIKNWRHICNDNRSIKSFISKLVTEQKAELEKEIDDILEQWTTFTCHSLKEHNHPDNDCPGWSHEYEPIRKVVISQIRVKIKELLKK